VTQIMRPKLCDRDMEKKTPETKKKPLPKKPATILIIDNTNIISWLMSCFFICGCMFFLGIMVGKNNAPVQFDVDRIEEKLSNLQVSVLNQKEADQLESPEPETATITKINNINAPSALPIIREDIIDQLKDKGRTLEIYEQYVPPVFTPKYAKTPPPKHKPKPVKKAPATESVKQQAEKSKPPEKSKPVTVLKPEIKSAPAKRSAPIVKPETRTVQKTLPETEKNIQRSPEPPGKGFAIQVASLKDPEKANVLMNKFKEKGYPAFCLHSEVNGATWHRVRIGPYPERALADKDQNRLKTAGVDSLVISMD
jgi:cell division septation protein DedD